MGDVVHSSDLHHLDPEREELVRQEAEQAQALRRSEQRDDLKFLLRGPVGRREVRRQLWVAGFDVAEERVPSIFDRHAAVMACKEAERAPGVQLIWTILRMLAQRELPADHFQQLMTETLSDDS